MCRNIDKDQWIDVMPLAIFFPAQQTLFIHLRISKMFCFVEVEQRKTCSCETWILKYCKALLIKHKGVCFFLGRFAQREALSVTHNEKIEQRCKMHL